MGREFRPETLSLAMSIPEADLMLRFDRLERRGLLRETGAGHYDFAHDLVREAVYRGLSQPRRRALHRQIAHALKAAAASDPGLHGELAYHASQAGDAPLAVRAYIATGEHCLRVFANPQAIAAAERGLAMLEQLPAGAERVSMHIELLKLRIVAASGTGARRITELRDQLQEAIETAELMGLYSVAASGLHMQSWLAQQANDLEATRVATLRAERLTRSADAVTHCQQLANSGRCLLEVESDMAHARALIAAASAKADSMNLQLIELEWARGLIARWDGELDTAQAALRTSVGLARVREDRWREFECLVWLATIELERGQFDAVEQVCQEVAEVATRMGDVNAPMGAALRSLASERRAPDGTADNARTVLEASLAEFRRLDDKVHLAYVLNQAAALDLEHDRLAQAEAAATEALGAAQRVGRNTEIIVAQALLACIDYARGKPERSVNCFCRKRGRRGSSKRTRQVLPGTGRASLPRQSNCKNEYSAHSNAGSNEGTVIFEPQHPINPGFEGDRHDTHHCRTKFRNSAVRRRHGQSGRPRTPLSGGLQGAMETQPAFHRSAPHGVRVRSCGRRNGAQGATRGAGHV